MSDDGMELGAFSVSIAVRDLGASRAFYQKLGFEQVGGDLEHDLITATGRGPAPVAFSDPDGNPILIDQSFPKPES
ncbi:MAG: hypothetical protein L7S64_09820 [Longimicrobiales bacterium]|jgi:catechol 2,3-dioxygenase-like lactoylglutathione lyase family enzyme|nr:hypothetical protein [Longimicrobiales bacterium]